MRHQWENGFGVLVSGDPNLIDPWWASTQKSLKLLKSPCEFSIYRGDKQCRPQNGEAKLARETLDHVCEREHSVGAWVGVQDLGSSRLHACAYETNNSMATGTLLQGWRRWCSLCCTVVDRLWGLDRENYKVKVMMMSKVGSTRTHSPFWSTWLH